MNLKARKFKNWCFGLLCQLFETQNQSMILRYQHFYTPSICLRGCVLINAAYSLKTDSRLNRKIRTVHRRSLFKCRISVLLFSFLYQKCLYCKITVIKIYFPFSSIFFSTGISSDSFSSSSFFSFPSFLSSSSSSLATASYPVSASFSLSCSP